MSADDNASDWEREFWLQRRQALLIELAAIERKLGLERSVAPKRKQKLRSGKADRLEEQAQTTA